MDFMLVGSAAAQYWVELGRWPADYDLIVRPRVFERWKNEYSSLINSFEETHPNKYRMTLNGMCGDKFEIEYAIPGSSAEWFMFHSEGANITKRHIAAGLEVGIAPPGALLALKRSHLTWPRFWQKHIADYHALLEAGHEMGNWRPGMWLRHEEKMRFDPPKEQTSLAVSNDEFFHVSESALQRLYSHDDLHLVVAYYDRPLYERCKTDINKAMLSQKLFNAMSPLNQQRLVREEAMAIALERRLVPLICDSISLVEAGVLDCVEIPSEKVNEAYSYALQRICTTLTSGWFRGFAIDNWRHIKTPDVDFAARFSDAVKTGKITRLAKHEQEKQRQEEKSF